MLTFLSGLAFWHWFVLGIALILIELAMPMAMLLIWPGIAAMMVGVMLTFVPNLTPIYQVGIWLVASFAFTLEWIKYCQDHPARPVATRRRHTGLPGEEYIGQQFTLQKPVIYGRGEIVIDDKTYPVLAIDDYPAGTLVKIVRVEVSALRIQQVM